MWLFLKEQKHRGMLKLKLTINETNETHI